MKVGLIDIEPKIFNTALMQISYWHKQRGYTVEWAAPLEYDKFDELYCSSLFDFTDKSQVPDRAICGGTGFDLTTKLPCIIEDCQLDYSIYPKCRTTYLWFSRGCVRNCPWCIVRQKEGWIKSTIPKNLNPLGNYITVQDNNFFESGNWWPAIQQLRYYNQPVDFQGIDVRTITEGQSKTLTTLKHYKQIKIAWDNPRDVKPFLSGLQTLTNFIKPYKIMCYVLIGHPGVHDAKDEDLSRVELLRDIGVDPFVMPYDKSDPYQKKFARWVNHKAIFKSVKWEDYR